MTKRRYAGAQDSPSQQTIAFLEALMAHWQACGKRFLVLFWDKAAWHTSRCPQGWVRAYNRRAKAEGLTRLIVCFLPTCSPWLMPLEPIFGHIKHQVLGRRHFETVSALQHAVISAFYQRIPQAKQRRERSWNRRLTMAQKSRSAS